MRTMLLILFAATTLSSLQAQAKSPIVLETLFGHQRAATTLSFNKTIDGRWRYNNITSTAAHYTHTKGRPELVSVNSIIFGLHQYIGISAGLQYHFVKGFIPTTAIHLTYGSPTWLFVLTPYYNFLPWSNLETIGIVEYKPHLATHCRLFTRVQGFYSYDFKQKETERTMLYARLGITYKQYTAGIGSNTDGYRPGRPAIQNYGLFLRMDI